MPARLLRRAAVSAAAVLLLTTSASLAASGPRVVDARVTPRTVHQGQQARLRVVVATPGSVRVTLDLVRHGRLVRTWLAMVPAAQDTRVVIPLPRRLQRGRYRVSIVSIAPDGAWSRPVARSLRVVGRR